VWPHLFNSFMFCALIH